MALEPTTTGAQGTCRVLIVDDDEDVLASISAVLELFGYSVTTAGSAREALRTYASKGADLVLLDIMMPKLSGLAVMRGLRRMKGRAPTVIVFSGHSQLVEKALAAGAQAALPKPCEVDQMLSLIANQLERRGC